MPSISPDSPTVPSLPPITPTTEAHQKDGETAINFEGAVGLGEAEQGHIDIDMNVGSFDFPGSMDNFSQFWEFSSSRPGDHVAISTPSTGASSAFNMDLNMELQPQLSLDFSGSISGGLYGISSGPVPRNGAVPGNSGDDGPREDELVQNHNMSGASVVTADNHHLETSIARLSILSGHLAQLLSSTKSLTSDIIDTSSGPERQHSALQVQVDIESVFTSISTWLVTGSPRASNRFSMTSDSNRCPYDTSELPQRVLSATHQLLEILRHTPGFIPIVTTSGGSASPSKPIIAKDSDSGIHHSYVAVHHLAHVCMTLLLSIYTALVDWLKRAADTVNSWLCANRTQALAGPNEEMDAVSRAHIQLVSVVQLCSYLFKNLNQTIGMILSRIHGPAHGQSSQGKGINQSVSASNDIASLRNEVGQRLMQLEESLLIIS